MLPLLSAMQSILFWIARNSLEASVLTAVTLIVLLLFQRGLTPQWRYTIWMLVVIRLLLPITIPSPLSLQKISDTILGIGPASQTVPTAIKTSTDYSKPSLQRARPPLMTRQSPPAVASSPQAPIPLRRPASNLYLFLVALWLTGSGIMAIRLLRGNFILASRLCRKRPLIREAVLEILEDCKDEMNIHAPMSITETPLVRSPALLGFVRPRLVIPEGFLDHFDEAELRHVFRHELAHFKRGDIAINWLICALQVIHWFNPVLWIAFNRIRTERESACDALALNLEKPPHQQTYGETIIKLLEFSSHTGWVPGMVGILEDRNQLKRRMIMIAQNNRSHPFGRLLGCTLLVLLATMGLTTAQPTSEETALPGPEATEGIELVTETPQQPGVASSNPTPFTPSEKAVVALSPLGTVEELDTMRAAVSDILQAELSQSDAILLVDRKQLRRVLYELQLGQEGMINAQSAQQLGEILGARYFCSGNLTQSGKRVMATVKIIDIETTLTKLAYTFLLSEDDVVEAGQTLAANIEKLIQQFEQDKVALQQKQPHTEQQAKPIPEDWSRPTVMVIIREHHASGNVIDPAGQLEITKRLIEAGFPVIDSEYVNVMKADELRKRKFFSSLHTAAQYAAKRDADVLLYGEAISERGARIGNFDGCRARIEIKAINTRDETILLADSAYAGATDLSDDVAGKKAIQLAANRLANTFLYSLCEKWNQR